MNITQSGITIKIMFFAQFREELGERQRQMKVPQGYTPKDVLAEVSAGHRRLEALREVVRFMVNGEHADEDRSLADGDELVFLPPVAGGESCAIVEQPIVLDELLRTVSHSGAGGVVLFLGVVRDNNDGRDVRFLEYEAYRSAAESSMRRIVAEAEGRWSGTRIAVVHRVGKLEIGEASVAVAASAVHRAEAFEAARYVIDTLKSETPIWKKEFFEGGEVWIGEPG